MHAPPLFVAALAYAAFAVGALYLHRAARISRFEALAFVVMIGYALFIESFDIKSSHSYYYSRFPLMIGRSPDWVPLSICASWASILFVCMRTSDLLGLPTRLRPLTDGLFAVALDLPGDPVMSATKLIASPSGGCTPNDGLDPIGGLGLWVWCVPEQSHATIGEVPLGNFVGWFALIALISAGLRAAAARTRNRGAWLQLLVVLAASVLAAAGVVAVLLLFQRLSAAGVSQWLLFLAVLGAPLLVLVRHARGLRLDHPFAWSLLLLPLWNYATIAWAYYRFGVERSLPDFAPLMWALMAGGTLLFFLPYLRRARRAG